MIESWSVGVLIRATSNIATVMAGGARATALSNSALKENNALLARNAAQQRVLRASAYIAGGIAAAGIAAMVIGVKQAADLQTAMTAVGITTRTTTEHMGAFYAMAVKMSGITAQSVSTIGKEMAVAATSGLSTTKQLLAAFPLIAKGADVAFLGPKHIDPVEAVKQLTQMTHLFGAYSGPAFTHMMNRAIQMMFVQPEGLQQFIAQGRMFIGPALSSGVSEDDIFKMAMTMGQTGFMRSRGGSGLARVIEYLAGAATMTGHLSAAQHKAMAGLGLTGVRGTLNRAYVGDKGNLLLGKVVDHLEAIRKNFSPMAFTGDLENAFGAQGSRFMQTILLPNVYAQVQKNWGVMTQLGNVDSMWKRYSDTFNFAILQFATNVKNVLGAVFLPLLPSFTTGLKTASVYLERLTNWLMKNPKAAASAGIAVMGAVVISSAIAVRALWQLNAAILATGAAASARTAETAGGLLPGVAGIGAGAAGDVALGGGLLADIGPLLVAAAVVGMGYGAVQLARNWAPLNAAIAGTVTDLNQLPGPLSNLGSTLLDVTSKLGILRKYVYRGTGDPNKDAKTLGLHLADKNLQWRPTPEFWQDNVWTPLGQSVSGDIASMPKAPHSLYNSLVNSINSWIDNVWNDLGPNDFAGGYHGGGRNVDPRTGVVNSPTVNVHVHGVSPNAREAAEHIANVVMDKIVRATWGGSDTTGVHYPAHPFAPSPAAHAP